MTRPADEFFIAESMTDGAFDALRIELESRSIDGRREFFEAALNTRLGVDDLERVGDERIATRLAAWPPSDEPQDTLASLFAVAEALRRRVPLPEAIDEFDLEDLLYDLIELSPPPWNAHFRRALRALEASTSDPGPLPERIGPFTVRRLVGEGAMGLVIECEAEDGGSVAVKLLKPTRSSEDTLRRFQDEIRVLRRLDHPGIAPILASGSTETTWGRVPWFAMPMVEGVPIDAASRGLDTRSRLALIRDVATAIHHAHQKGIIHRDLKPANILVTESGRCVILDFGVAKLIDSRERTTLRRTVGNMVVGTLAYMSPEQAKGDPGAIDIRSDIYSAGAILFEILGGAPPVDLAGMGFVEALGKIQTARPKALSTIDPSLAGDVETIVATCLARDPADRYPSAAALANDLTRHLEGHPITARRPTRLEAFQRWVAHHRLLAGSIFGGALLLIGLASVALLGWRSALREKDIRIQREQAAIGIAGSHLQSIRLLARLGASSDDRLRLLESYRAWFRSNESGIRENPEFSRTFADILQEFGSLEVEQGHFERALPLRKEALEIRESLAASPPKKARDQRALSIAVVQLGDIFLRQGKLRATMDLYMRAMAIDESLHAAYPKTPGYLDDLNWSHERVAQLFLRMGRWEDFARHIVKRWRLSKELLDLDPDRVLSMENRVEALRHFAALFSELGIDDPRIDRSLEESAGLTRELIDRLPEDPRQFTRLEAVYVSQARRAQLRDDIDGAMRIVNEAVTIREQLRTKDPNDIDDLFMLISLLRFQAALEKRKSGIFPDSLARRILGLGEAARKLAPRDPQTWIHLAMSCHILASLAPDGSETRTRLTTRALRVLDDAPAGVRNTLMTRSLRLNLLLSRGIPEDLKKGLQWVQRLREESPEVTEWGDIEARFRTALGLPTESPEKRAKIINAKRRTYLYRLIEEAGGSD